MIGQITGTSPIMLEHLVRSYTGSMGMAAMAVGDLVIPRDGPAPVEKRLSDRPLLSTVFQSDNALGVVSATYDRFEEAIQAKKTYEKLLKDGQPAKAQAYLDKHLNEIQLSGMAGLFRQQMGEITQYERAVRASTRSPSEKRVELDRMRQVKIDLAKRARAAVDRNTRPAAP
jgi:hypothetical protein